MAALSESIILTPPKTLSTSEQFELLKTEFINIEIQDTLVKMSTLKATIDTMNPEIEEFSLDELRAKRVSFDKTMVDIKKTVESARKIKVKINDLKLTIETQLPNVSRHVIKSASILNPEMGKSLQSLVSLALENLSQLKSYFCQIESLLDIYEGLKNHTFKRFSDNTEARQEGRPANSLFDRGRRYLTSGDYDPGQFCQNSE